MSEKRAESRQEGNAGAEWPPGHEHRRAPTNAESARLALVLLEAVVSFDYQPSHISSYVIFT